MRALPATLLHHKRIANGWIAQRTAQKRQKLEHASVAIHTFVETVDGHDALFAFQALREPASTKPKSLVLRRSGLKSAPARSRTRGKRLRRRHWAIRSSCLRVHGARYKLLEQPDAPQAVD